MLLGGAFWPLERAAVGAGLSVVLAVAAAIGWRGWSPAERATGLLLVWAAVVATAVARDRLVAREVLVAWAAAAAVWIVVRRSDRLAVVLERVTVVVAALVAAGVIADAGVNRTVRGSAMFDSPNLAAAAIVVLIPTAWCRLPPGRLRVAVTALLAVGSVATGSRAAVLAALAAAWWLLPAGRVRRLSLVAAAAIVVLVVGWRLAVEPDPLAWHRPAIWGALLRMVAQHPVQGVGPGDLADATGPYRLAHPERIVLHEHVIGTADSTVVAVAATLGVVGLLLAGVAVLRWILDSGRTVDPGIRRWSSATAGAMAVMALFHDLLATEPLLWWWAAVLGLCAPVAGPRPRSSRVAWPAAVAGLGIGLLGLVTPNVARIAWRAGAPDPARIAAVERLEPWLATPLEWRVRDLMAAPDWSWTEAAEAAAMSDRLVELRPGVYSAWLWSGRVAARTAVDLGAWPSVVDRARGDLERAASLEPHLPWAWLDRARLEDAVGGPEAARPFVRAALEAEPRCAAAWVLIARGALREGHVETAREALREVEAAAELATSPGVSAYAVEVLTPPASELRLLERALR
jgi:hypothetical protein